MHAILKKILIEQKGRQMKPMKQTRCRWCNPANERYIRYHDEEWGVPTYDDALLYELFILEPFQAGLSWETILNKRENFKRAFENYDMDKIAAFDARRIEELLTDASIIRNRRKIEAAIHNTGVFREIQKEWGSFHAYIWHFTGNQVIREWDKTSSPLSDEITADLKKRGAKFIGTTIIYSYLQAVGIINSHEPTCFLYPDSSNR